MDSVTLWSDLATELRWFLSTIYKFHRSFLNLLSGYTRQVVLVLPTVAAEALTQKNCTLSIVGFAVHNLFEK